MPKRKTQNCHDGSPLVGTPGNMLPNFAWNDSHRRKVPAFRTQAGDQHWEQ